MGWNLIANPNLQEIIATRAKRALAVLPKPPPKLLNPPNRTSDFPRKARKTQFIYTLSFLILVSLIKHYHNLSQTFGLKSPAAVKHMNTIHMHTSLRKNISRIIHSGSTLCNAKKAEENSF